MPQGRSIAGPVLTLALLGGVAAFYVYLNVDSYATKIVNRKIRESLAGSRFVASVRSANIVEGKGLELHDLEIIHLGQPQTKLVSADKLTVRVPASIKDLVSQQIVPESMQIQRARFIVGQPQFDKSFLAELKGIIANRTCGKPFPVHIRESQVVLRSPQSKAVLTLDDFAADILPAGSDEQFKIVTKSTGKDIAKLETRTILNPALGQWKTDLVKLDATVTPKLASFLPQSVVSQLGKLQLSGKLSASGAIQSTAEMQSPRFRFDCYLAGVNARSSLQPYPLYNVNLRMSLNNNGLKVQRARGKMGMADFDIVYQQTGLMPRKRWSASGVVKNTPMEKEIAHQFSYSCDKFFRDFAPTGFADLQFRIDSNGNKDVFSKIRDVSFSFRKFPYRIEGGVGKVRWVNDVLDFQLSAIEHGQQVDFDGKVYQPGPQATYQVHFRSGGRLPINQKMLNGLRNEPKIARIVRDFRPVGFVSGKGTIKKSRPGARPTRDIDLQLHDCRVRYAKFDYPFEKVQGKLNIANDRVTFHDVAGVNGLARASCNGVWERGDGLQLVFNCDAVPLDSQLRNALSRNLQSVWDGLRPTGTTHNGKVFVNYPYDTRKVDVRVRANLTDPQFSGLRDANAPSVQPTWFPYRLSEIKGEVEIGGGQIVLRNMIGRHDETWVSCQAEGQYSAHGWSLTLNDLLARSLKPNRDLLQALPDNLADAIQRLDFKGQVNLSGNMTFAQSQDSVRKSGNSDVQLVNYEIEPGPLNSSWDLRLDMDQARMRVGVPIDNVFGSIRLSGRDSGNKTECAGQVSMDSLSIYGLQVTNIRGPIWIDDNQTLAGRFANSANGESGSLAGELFGGTINFDGWVSHGSDFPFNIQTTIEKSRLEDLAAEIAPHLRELSGDGYGFLQLTGNANELHTYTGQGNLHLRNAEIHQLPVILSLLKLLSVKEPNRTAFDSSNVDFSINGKQLKLDRIELIGDAISLIGNGYMEMMRHADINFYSVVGRNRIYIPLLSDLYRASSQRIMWINIGGPLNNLQTSRKMLPGLDDSLRALLNNRKQSNIEDPVPTYLQPAGN